MQTLTNINISEITLCKAGMNGLQFIAKSADGSPRFQVAIKKTDAVKKVAVGVVYQPDQPDAEGDTASAEEIEKAAWSALKNHAVVNKAEHGSAPVGAFLAESYICKANDPDEFPEGAWAVVVKIEDESLWSEIEKGDIAAFSMGGKAQKAPVEKSVSIDSMIYATGLKDVLAVVNSVAAALGDTVEKIAALQKVGGPEVNKTADEQPPAPSQSEESPAMADLRKQMEALQETVNKIAEVTTDGRATSPEPGTPAIDPARY